MTASKAPHSRARDRQREETREQILRAVARQLEAGQMDDLGFADVAKEAGVGERTVYRHFPTKEALLGAFWSWMQAQAQAQAQGVERPRPPPAMPRRTQKSPPARSRLLPRRRRRIGRRSRGFSMPLGPRTPFPP